MDRIPFRKAEYSYMEVIFGDNFLQAYQKLFWVFSSKLMIFYVLCVTEWNNRRSFGALEWVGFLLWLFEYGKLEKRFELFFVTEIFNIFILKK